MTYPEAFGKVFFNPLNLCFYGILQSDANEKFFMLINLSRMQTASNWSKGKKKLPKELVKVQGKFTVIEEGKE
jgi:hypothetical protein